MKRLLSSITILLIVFTVSGCVNTQYESTSRIVRPNVKTAPLQGTWLVQECMTREPGTPQESQGDRLMGMEVGFSNDSIVFGNYLWNDVIYKIKRVNTEEYFLHRYRNAAKMLDIKDKEIYVIQVSSGENYLYEFVKIDDKLIAALVNSNLYCLSKTSDKFNGASKKLANEEGPDIILEGDNKSKELSSGVLLSLRIPQSASQSDNGTAYEKYRYQTYWIAFTGGRLRPILTAPDIYLPRKDGFWRIKSRKTADNSSVSGVIYASRASSTSQERLIRTNNQCWYIDNSEAMRNRDILYVGNDYICFEDTYYILDKTKQSRVKKELRTLPVDRMDEISGIKLSDIAGQNGTMAVEEALADLLKNTKNSLVKSIENFSSIEQNFALFRNSGHWFLKGRINFGKEYPVPFTDFNLNLLPPSDMVAYDTLHVPWTVIKDRIPQAIDAYTSPNKDMALVLTRNSLIIYAINGNDISNTPMMRFPILEGSSVVMAEWGTGNYMKNWEKSFVSNNPVREIKVD